MNTKFLGDAFDHWKGSLIDFLQRQELVHELVVEPMITDGIRWSEKDLETYRRLLRLGMQQPIYHEGLPFNGDRTHYFHDIPDGDLFLDPDTGIATGKSTRKHISILEIKKLLDSDPAHQRVLIVYQHSARGNFHSRLDAIGGKISENIFGIHLATYECGHVALFFVSHSRARIRQIGEKLREYLSGTASKRISTTD